MRRLVATHTRRWRRRVTGAVWLVAWAVVLRWAHHPWEILGGVISERVRWLERLVMGAGFIVGCFVGSFVRDAAQLTIDRCHADALRRVWIPPAAVAGAAMILVPYWSWKLLVFVALLAYSAGLDAAIGAWPLLNARPYAFRQRIQADDEVGGTGSTERVRSEQPPTPPPNG